MNPTIIRKFTTSMVHEYRPELKRSTAHHLNHSVAVADANYDLVNKLKGASNISKQLCNIQRKDTQVASSRTDNESVLFLFAEEVKKKLVTAEGVRRTLMDAGLDVDKGNVKRTLDMVRYRIKKSKHCDETEDFFENTMNRDETTPVGMTNQEKFEKYETCTQTRPARMTYSDEDNFKIRKYLAPYIKTNRKVVRQEFEKFVNGIDEMKEIMGKFGLDSHIVKIRTERKKS